MCNFPITADAFPPSRSCFPASALACPVGRLARPQDVQEEEVVLAIQATDRMVVPTDRSTSSVSDSDLPETPFLHKPLPCNDHDFHDNNFSTFVRM